MFINISKDVSVNVDEIIAVEYLDQLHSQVHLAGKTFKADMSKTVLMSIISKERDSSKSIAKMIEIIAKGQTTPTP